MRLIISNSIRVKQPTQAVIDYCKKELVIDNPDYINAQRLGLYSRNIEPKLSLYAKSGNDLILPFGCIRHLWGLDKHIDIDLQFAPFIASHMHGCINLYEYQKPALEALKKTKNGVLKAPCGSGKTNIALQLIKELGGKALWLTHTKKLLEQSKARCESYFEGDFGTITEGAVNIGSDITFATVQTMSKIDPQLYKNEFSVVVVDECFAGETLIKTNKGNKQIKDIKEGDIVASYNEKTHRIEWKKVLKTMIHQDREVICINDTYCTSNHPWFTQRGWVKAEEINKNDQILRCVWKGSKKQNKNNMFSRMLLQTFFNTNEEEKPNVRPPKKRKSFKNIKKNELEAQRKRGKWNRRNTATNKTRVSIIRQANLCNSRIRDTNKNAKRKCLPTLLQNRFSNTECQNSNRNRWSQSSFNLRSRKKQKEKRVLKFYGLESVSLQKCGDTKQYRKCTVYNLEVEDNHNYFANNYLVHNCHHLVGSPTKAMQFYKVINSINCRYKFGMSATLTRTDGMIPSLFALIGDIVYEIPKEAVKDKRITAEYKPIFLSQEYNVMDYTDFDGTINNTKLLSLLAENTQRNEEIVNNIVERVPHSQLVLCHRVAQCETLSKMLEERGVKTSILVGKVKEKDRDYDASVIIATYALAKEGLDIPALDTLHLASPQKNESVTIQAIGRIERNIEGKEIPICYDYVDENIPYCMGCYKKRKRIIKQND